MNWRLLLPLPLAALWVGKPLVAPKLAPPLSFQGDSCSEKAAAFYLRAYAYANENPFVARKLLAAAEAEWRECHTQTEELARRLIRLKKALYP